MEKWTSVSPYFRVENEHTTNAGMFRATLEVPLPFTTDELSDGKAVHVEGLTFFHFSAHHEPFLTQNAPSILPDTF